MRYLIILIIFLLTYCSKPFSEEFPDVEVIFDISKSEDCIYAGEGFVVVNLSKNASEITWDFGDGTFSSDSIFLHSYSKKGNYILTLTACNPGNCESIKMAITVKDSVLTLLTGDNSKKWNLYRWIDKNGHYIQFDTCFCNYSYTFHDDGQIFALNTGQQICGLDTLQCSDYHPSFRFHLDPFNRKNYIWIGHAEKLGYEIDLDYNLLFLKSPWGEYRIYKPD